MRKYVCLLLIFVVVVCFSRVSKAAEHPGQEHPGATHEHEHPGEKAMLSQGDIIKGIKGHIDEVTAANNGYYPLNDSWEGKDLRLKLVKVHEDRVSYIKKEDAYFACTDFITTGGTKYDVDFWMKKGDKGKLEVYQTKIHKKDGTPRFTYKDDGIMPVEGSQAPEEGSGPMQMQMTPEERS